MFTIETIRFLQELTLNNNRIWFNENKSLYEDVVRGPALNFIGEFKPELAKLSSHFVAIPKKIGGSMMRPNRDVRFSKDKSPYKTNVGIQFRHHLGKDVHAPGFYLHISPQEIFVGAGIWHPESKALRNIRNLIDEAPSAWKAVKNSKAFNKEFEFIGSSLVNNPRGFSKDHINIEDLKRKDFIAISPISKKELYSKDLSQIIFKKYKCTISLMRFLCEAQRLNF